MLEAVQAHENTEVECSENTEDCRSPLCDQMEVHLLSDFHGDVLSIARKELLHMHN